MNEQEEVEALSLLTAIQSTRALMGKRRGIAGGLTVLVLGLYSMLFYTLFADFNGDAFNSALAEGLGRRAPAIGRQFSESSSGLIPAYSEALAQQAEPRMLSLSNRLSKEVDLLIRAVQEVGNKRSAHTLAVAAERIDSALAAAHPELAKDEPRRKALGKQILAAFEQGAGKVIADHAAAPSRELERLIAETAVTAVAANKSRKPLGNAPELRMVVSMLGVVARELVAQKARLLEDTQ
jgi:hypothetical protein